MRSAAIVAITLMMVLGGCADTNGTPGLEETQDEPSPSLDNSTVEIKRLVALLAIDNATVASGAMFNITIDASVEIVDGNESDDGNETADGGNETAGDQNGTTESDLSGAAWSLTATDPAGNVTGQWNGTGVPAVAAINLTGNGSFLLALVVTLDDHERGKANLTVDVLAPVVEAAEPWTWEGTSLLPCAQCPLLYNVCVGLNAGSNGRDCVWVDLPEDAPGKMITIDSSAGDISYDFMSACDGDGDGLGYDSDAATPLQAEIPAGTTCILLYHTSGTSTKASLLLP